MTYWKTLAVEREFTVEVPVEAEWTLDENAAHFVVRLPTNPATELRVSRHPQAKQAAPHAYLEQRVRDFFKKCIPSTNVGGLVPSIQQCVTNSDVIQGVAQDGAGQWWLVRAHDVGREFFWLQWCGPEQPLKEVVLKIFESFTPTLPGNGVGAS